MDGGYLLFFERGDLLFSRRLTKSEICIDKSDIASFLSECEPDELEIIFNETKKLINKQ